MDTIAAQERQGTDRLLEFYKIAVEDMRDARKSRRDLANFFITTNATGITGLGVLATAPELASAPLIAWLCMALIVICLVWQTSNAYYTRVLAAKFSKIYEIEKLLEFDIFQTEAAHVMARGRSKFFSLERALPLLLIVSYVVFYFITVSDAGFETFLGLVRSIEQFFSR